MIRWVNAIWEHQQMDQIDTIRNLGLSAKFRPNQLRETKQAFCRTSCKGDLQLQWVCLINTPTSAEWVFASFCGLVFGCFLSQSFRHWLPSVSPACLSIWKGGQGWSIFCSQLSTCPTLNCMQSRNGFVRWKWPTRCHFHPARTWDQKNIAATCE